MINEYFLLRSIRGPYYKGSGSFLVPWAKKELAKAYKEYFEAVADLTVDFEVEKCWDTYRLIFGVKGYFGYISINFKDKQVLEESLNQLKEVLTLTSVEVVTYEYRDFRGEEQLLSESCEKLI